MITRLLAGLTFSVVFLAEAVQANTEKVIFLAPSPQTLPNPLDTVSKLQATTLSPEQLTIRASLPVAFPTSERPRGSEYWYLLRHLNPEQRYEIRVCWAASQPTEFWLNAFDIDQIDPDSASQLGIAESDLDRSKRTTSKESILALRIQAAADFFTSNQTLMRFPPPVDVDIILDPYLLNVFPTSLLPTAVYISILAVVGYFVSGLIWEYLRPVIETPKLRTD